MQQYVVPQFIDVESKIIGPITIRQFVILLVAALFTFIAYKLSDFSLFIVEALVIFAVFGLFAFFKINGQPMHYFILNFSQSLMKPKLRVWRNLPDKTVDNLAIKKSLPESGLNLDRRGLVSSTRLEELSLIIDTGGVYRGE